MYYCGTLCKYNQRENVANIEVAYIVQGLSNYLSIL